MKKIQLGFFVAALALSASAFTKAQEGTKDWYLPISSTLSPTSSDAQEFSSYNPTPVNEPDCRGGSVVCASEFPNTSQPPTTIATHN